MRIVVAIAAGIGIAILVSIGIGYLAGIALAALNLPHYKDWSAVIVVLIAIGIGVLAGRKVYRRLKHRS